MKKILLPFIYLYRLLKVIFFTLIVYFIFSIFIILYLRFFPPLTTAFINDYVNDSIFSFVIPSEVEYKWESIENITPYMGLAVIASEDQRFAEHFGFDIKEIEKAIKEKEKGRKVRGASTISQQTAKNLFLSNDKTYIRKGFEAYYTLLIELLWTKKDILETYINIAELGEGIYGVQAASQTFFKKDAIKLRQEQAAILAAVIPSPKRFKANRPSAYILRRKGQILNQMNLIGGKAYLEKFM